MERYHEIRRTFSKIRTDSGWIPCMLYEPVHPDARECVGIVLMHSDDDYIEFTPAMELAKRGYRVAASRVARPGETLDCKIKEVGKVLEYLRTIPGIRKVLLLGHSGGATLMSAYQNIAENGPEGFMKNRIIALSGIEKLEPADGMLLLDSNFGNGVMTLLSLDPSVADEDTGRHRDASLDMFDPANGYGLGECSYSEAFMKHFLLGQADRMNHLIDFCQERVRIIDRGVGHFVDDEPIVIPGGVQFGPCNKLFPQLPWIFSHTKKAYTLIHGDGSETTEIIRCRRLFRQGEDTTRSFCKGALVTSVRTFLKSSAVRVDRDQYGYDESGLYGIDWRSSYCVTVGNMEGVSAPLLLMGMTGSYEYIAAEHIWQHAKKAEDKTIAFVEGAGHIFTPALEAEQYPGEFGDTVKNCFDFCDRWIAERFV